MNETLITLQGNVGGDVTIRQAGDATVASFRVGSTPRRYQRRTDEWVDAPTQWYTVNAWRGLAGNCGQSLRRGDAVVVHGKLSAQTWVNNNGQEVTTFEVEAAFVGHDLTRGTSAFTRTPRAQGDAPATTTTDPGAEQATEPEAGAEEVSAAAA